jgi:hypothetical protein
MIICPFITTIDDNNVLLDSSTVLIVIGKILTTPFTSLARPLLFLQSKIVGAPPPVEPSNAFTSL